MKVLVVTNLYPTQKRPFISSFVKEQVVAMRKNNPNITIDVYVIEGWRPRWAYIRAMLLLPDIVKKGKYDIVHAHFGLTLISTLFINVPVIITFHGSDLLMSPTKYLSKCLAPTAQKVIVVSKKLKETIGYGEVIPCGIDIRRFALPLGFKKQQSPKMQGEINILFPSDPNRKVKNYSLFYNACRELDNRGYKVNELHLANIKQEKVPELYWKCDVMIMTSFSEGSPTVIKEAIAAKLPFVAVDVGDIRDWAESINFGEVVSNYNPKTIADAVCKVISRVRCREDLDNSKCIKAMDIDFLNRRIIKLYEEALCKKCKLKPN